MRCPRPRQACRSPVRRLPHQGRWRGLEQATGIVLVGAARHGIEGPPVPLGLVDEAVKAGKEGDGRGQGGDSDDHPRQHRTRRDPRPARLWRATARSRAAAPHRPGRPVRRAWSRPWPEPHVIAGGPTATRRARRRHDDRDGRSAHRQDGNVELDPGPGSPGGPAPLASTATTRRHRRRPARLRPHPPAHRGARPRPRCESVIPSAGAPPRRRRRRATDAPGFDRR